MPTIRLSGTAIELFKFPALEIDEFIPVVKFNRQSFTRPADLKLIEISNSVSLSLKIEQCKRSVNLFKFTVQPGLITLPFSVEKGFGTWDDDGYIEAVIEPQTANVQFTSNSKFKVKYGQQFQLTLNITGHQERVFTVNFYANDDEDDYNCGELKNIHCGRIEFNVAGSSAVGFKLIENIDALPAAPANFISPLWNTTNISEIALSQQQANLYNNCGGVCYATTASRTQQAYIDTKGTGVIDLSVSNKNIDHRIASTQGGNDPFMGYGAGGPFARRGFGQTVDNAGVWNGDLKRGALLQIWHSSNPNNLYENGGHSVIFRNYLYDNNGTISGIAYTDYHGGIRPLERIDYISETILGVNLFDFSL